MKLTFEEIKKITVGALQIWESAEGFHFCKMTAAQLDAFDALSSMLGTNARANTGVRLDFHTDASFIRYTTLTDGKYELKIDGTLTSYVMAVAGEPVTVTLPDDAAMHRITLHLPSHGKAGGFSAVEISDGATLMPHTFDCKMLFIGDSITQGWNTELDTLSYAYLVSDHFNANSVIQGVGGAYYDASTPDKTDFDPDTVFVAYGTNDSNNFKTLEEIDARCTAFLEKLMSLYPTARIYVISPPWRTDYNREFAYGAFALVGKTIRSVAERLGLSVIVGEDMIPPLSIMMHDNVHPNALGFTVYAHNLIKELEK